MSVDFPEILHSICDGLARIDNTNVKQQLDVSLYIFDLKITIGFCNLQTFFLLYPKFYCHLENP